jgi:tRNA-dihydrouridine synthase B
VDQWALGSPFAIGAVAVPNRVALAPMAGITGSAYRRHLKTHGVGLVTTEMVSAYGLVYRNTRTSEYLRFAEQERPVAVQLFGDTPEVMARAAEIVLSRSPAPDLIDINMGCPVRKVVKTGAGSALLAEPDRAAAMAAAVVDKAAAAGVPVTVKLRGGLKPGDGLGALLAPRLEQVGVAALTVHPRAASEFYRGPADHSLTAAIAGAVGIPVLASGDINTVEAAARVLEATGAVAVMVARGCVGNPWLVDALVSGAETPRPPLQEVVADLRSLLAGAEDEMGSIRAARWIRKLLGWYLRPSGVQVAVIEELRRIPDAAALDAALALLRSC